MGHCAEGTICCYYCCCCRCCCLARGTPAARKQTTGTSDKSPKTLHHHHFWVKVTPQSSCSIKLILLLSICNPSNAETTFVQSTRTQRYLKTHLIPVMLVFIWKPSLSTLSWVPRVSVIFQYFYHFILAKLATISIRVNSYMLKSFPWKCILCMQWYFLKK